MMNFVGTDGYFINLSAVAIVEDVTDGGESKAILTTIAGVDIEIEGKDADMLFERVETVTLEQAFTASEFRNKIEALRLIAEQQQGATAK